MFSGKRFVFILLGAVTLAGLAAGLSASTIRYAGPIELVRVETLSSTDYETIGRYATIDAALADIGGGGSLPAGDGFHRYQIRIPPGEFDLGATQIVMEQYVDIIGSGQDKSTLTCYCGSATSPTSDGSSAALVGANHATLRDLTIRNVTDDSDSYAVGIHSSGLGGASTFVIANVTAHAELLDVSIDLYGYGIYNDNSSPTMTNVTATALAWTFTSNYAYAAAVYNDASSPIMTNVTAHATANTALSTAEAFGVRNDGSSPIMTNVTATADGNSGTSTNTGVYNVNSSPIMTNVIADAKAVGTLWPSTSIGVNSINSSPAIDGLAVDIVPNTGIGYGVLYDGPGSVSITRSSITAPDIAIGIGPSGELTIETTMFDGEVFGGPVTCINATDAYTNLRDTDCVVRTLRVAPDSHYPTITSALDDIGGGGNLPAATSSLRYTVLVGPGTYDEQVTMEAYVDIVGSGRDLTTITYGGSNTSPATDDSSATVIGADNASVRDLTIDSSASGNSYGTGVYANGTSPRLTRVNVRANSASNTNAGVWIDGGATLLLDDVLSEVTTVGGTNLGIASSNTSSFVLNHVTVNAPNGVAIQIYDDLVATAQDVTIVYSDIQGIAAIALSDPNYTIRIGASELTGTLNYATGRWTCAESWDGAFAPYDNACTYPAAGSVLPPAPAGDAPAPSEPPTLPGPGE